MLEQRERRTFLTPETWTLCLTGQHKVSQKISTIFPNNSLGMPDFLFYSARREHIYFGSYRTTLPNHLTQGSPHSLNVLTLGLPEGQTKLGCQSRNHSIHYALKCGRSISQPKQSNCAWIQLRFHTQTLRSVWSSYMLHVGEAYVRCSWTWADLSWMQLHITLALFEATAPMLKQSKKKC